jgi:hypothetical protein
MVWMWKSGILSAVIAGFDAARTKNASSRRPASEEEQVAKKEKNGDRRGTVFVEWNDDETVAEQRARVLRTLGVMRSGIGSKRMELVSRDLNAATNIRRCVVLKTRPEQLTRSNAMWQLLRLEVCVNQLEPIAGGGSKKAGRRPHVGIYLPSMAGKHVSCY